MSFRLNNFINKENILDNYSVNTKLKKTFIPKTEITFLDQSGFGAYVVEDNEENIFNISGVFIAPLIIGQTYEGEGIVTIYRSEKQLKVEKIRNVKPTSKKGIIKYLRTLKGLKSKAEIIYNHFGDDCIRILMEDPMHVANTIKGIGKKSVLNWKEQLDKLSESQATITTLLGYGISNKESRKLYEKYHDNIIPIIEENPYFLATAVRGYGFISCDRIAREVGISPQSPYRLQEGLIYILEKSVSAGHCYLPLENLISEAMDLLRISLSCQEMIRSRRDYAGQEKFTYSIGHHQYTINYNRMVKCLHNYMNEKQSFKRENHRYVVLQIEEDEINEQIKEILMQHRIVADNNKVYLNNTYDNEVLVSEKVKEISQTKKIFTTNEVEKELNFILKEKNIILEKKQREACIDFNTTKGGFYILNGSAGTGKTFTLMLILETAKRLYKKSLGRNKNLEIMVFAPTGKASKVASKSTGMDCITVHRGLGYNPQGGFEYNEDNPLQADIIVCDESSMLDISLARYLFSAIKAGTKVILMGDTKQLPSVGAGNVLKDLIESNIVRVITLNVIKRQGLLSGVIKNANNIIEGKMVRTYEDTKDAYVVKRQTIKGCQKAIVDSIKRLLQFNEYTLDEIQLLIPQRKGSLGTYLFNYFLQEEFNPGNNNNKVLSKKFEARPDETSNSIEFKLYFKKGDKVIHIKNNYDIEHYIKFPTGHYKKIDKTGITNGECGVIEDIITIPGKQKGDDTTRIIVRYEDIYVFYDDNFNELEHSYALTIHKSQGSAWKAVIIPVMTQHWNMLDANLLYTAWTRARKFGVIVGSEKALRHAITTHKSRNRYTNLKERLVS